MIVVLLLVVVALSVAVVVLWLRVARLETAVARTVGVLEIVTAAASPRKDHD